MILRYSFLYVNYICISLFDKLHATFARLIKEVFQVFPADVHVEGLPHENDANY